MHGGEAFDGDFDERPIPQPEPGSSESDRANARVYHAWKEWDARYAEWCEERGRELSPEALFQAKRAYSNRLYALYGKRTPDEEWRKRKTAWDDERPGPHLFTSATGQMHKREGGRKMTAEETQAAIAQVIAVLQNPSIHAREGR